MSITTDSPDIQVAGQLLVEAELLNPGPWVQHSRLVAQAAKSIAVHMPDMDAQKATILGLLHDIGRRAGVCDLLHILHGYNYLENLGYPAAARICITHGFRIQDVRTAGHNWDGTPQELAFVERVLAQYEYDPYDRLIQLCDALATGDRFCMIEQRLVDVALRRGIKEHTLAEWRVLFEVKTWFEQRLGQSIYACLPGVASETSALLLTVNGYQSLSD